MTPQFKPGPVRHGPLLVAAAIVLAVVLVGVPLYRMSLAASLRQAISRQDAEAVAALLRRGAPADAADENGSTPLSLAFAGTLPFGVGAEAVPGSRARIVASLLEAGADPNRFNAVPDLYLALSLRSLPMVKDLLAHRANPNTLFSGSPLLMTAVADDAQLHALGEQEQPLFTQALLAAGAEAGIRRPFVGEVDDMGSVLLEELPLIVAVRQSNSGGPRHGDPALLETLLAHGVNVDARDHRGRAALFVAAAAGDPDDTRVLLAQGADPSQTDSSGLTALQAARKALADDLARTKTGAGGQRTAGGVTGTRNDKAPDVETRYRAVEAMLVRAKPPDGL